MEFPRTTTKGGTPVIIYTMAAKSQRSIHGAWESTDGWTTHSWLPEGKHSNDFDSTLDLEWPIKNENIKRKG